MPPVQRHSQSLIDRGRRHDSWVVWAERLLTRTVRLPRLALVLGIAATMVGVTPQAFLYAWETPQAAWIFSAVTRLIIAAIVHARRQVTAGQLVERTTCLVSWHRKRYRRGTGESLHRW